MTICWVRVACHLDPRVLVHELTERLGEVPTGELKLVPDHPGSGKVLKLLSFSLLPKVLPEYTFHFLHILHIPDTNSFQLTQTFLHPLIQTKLLRLKSKLYILRI